MADYRRDLEQLEWEIEESAHWINDQRARITELERDGKNAAGALETLRVLETNQGLAIARRKMVQSYNGSR